MGVLKLGWERVNAQKKSVTDSESLDYLNYKADVQGASSIYGAEYETGDSAYVGGPLASVNDHNVPCAVCCAVVRRC